MEDAGYSAAGMRRRLVSLAVFGLLGCLGMLGAVSGSSAASPPAWGNAITVPGMPAPAFNNSGVRSVSCPAAGSCTAGGLYHDSSGSTHAFVVDETSGSWGNATEVPGTTAL